MYKSIYILVISFIANISAQSEVYRHPEWSYNKTIYEANIRQFSEKGNFEEFRKLIPGLKEMGIGIIWLMPVNPIGEKKRKGILGSYYAVKDYLEINPEFGTKKDFKSLVEEIHNNGMYVIIDWVANHTSPDNNLTLEHPDWFTKDSAGNFVTPNSSWTDVIDLNYDNAGLRAYMINAMKYWVEEFDIDGYRCDVAELVPLDFWIGVRRELESIKPVFMLAEGEKPELHQAFDMTYSWTTLTIMKNIAAGKSSSGELYDFLINEPKIYPAGAFRMRFTTSHDENSWNGTDYELFGEGRETFAAVISLLPGMPLVYSGQEAGLNKRLKFFEKDPIEWKQDKMRNVYTALFNLKKNNPALFNGDRGGEYIPITTGNDPKIFSFIRKRGEDKIFAVFNFSAENKEINLYDPEIEGTYKDLFSGKKQDLQSEYKLNLRPWEYVVLVRSS